MLRLFITAPLAMAAVDECSRWYYAESSKAEIALSDRISLDLRYELSTQTHQVQAGLIYNYQKEYFWKK
jgi:hypothetical protein